MDEVNVLRANAYQKLAARTVNHNLTNSEQELHALHGLAAEVGELHSIFQKKYQGHPADMEHVMKELGDILWFIAEFCTANYLEMEAIMMMNIKKLNARYPEGFEADKSVHKKDGDI